MLNRPYARGVVTALLLGALSACHTNPVYIKADTCLPRRLAVLPMANDTTDLDGPAYVRKLLIQRLPALGFEIIPTDEIDAKLKDEGFTDGGQLRAANVKDMGEWLKANALMYSTLLEFSYVNVGFYWHRKVKLTARIVRPEDNERLWETERGWMSADIATNTKDAKRQFAEQGVVQAAERMTHLPLSFETARAVDALIATIPALRCDSLKPKGESNVP